MMNPINYDTLVASFGITLVLFGLAGIMASGAGIFWLYQYGLGQQIEAVGEPAQENVEVISKTMEDASTSAENAASTTKRIQITASSASRSAGSVSDSLNSITSALDGFCRFELTCPSATLSELQEHEENSKELESDLSRMSSQMGQNAEDLEEMSQNFEKMSQSADQLGGQMNVAANASSYPINIIGIGVLAWLSIIHLFMIGGGIILVAYSR